MSESLNQFCNWQSLSEKWQHQICNFPEWKLEQSCNTYVLKLAQTNFLGGEKNIDMHSLYLLVCFFVQRGIQNTCERTSGMVLWVTRSSLVLSFLQVSWTSRPCGWTRWTTTTWGPTATKASPRSRWGRAIRWASSWTSTSPRSHNHAARKHMRAPVTESWFTSPKQKQTLPICRRLKYYANAAEQRLSRAEPSWAGCDRRSQPVETVIAQKKRRRCSGILEEGARLRPTHSVCKWSRSERHRPPGRSADVAMCS